LTFSQRSGGGGAPTTGADYSPGEGVTEEQMRRSGIAEDDQAKRQ
jgi:hypothetical protein